MQDFGRWLANQKPAEVVEPEKELPEGLYLRNGVLWATCRSCENDYEWAASEEDYDPDMSYCGGSYRCIP